MSYDVKVLPSAAKDLRRLPNDMVSRLHSTLGNLREQPRPVGSQKLVNVHPETWRVRVGDWRVLYRVNDELKMVYVVTVAHRREVYR